MTTRLDRWRLVEPWVYAIVISGFGAVGAAVAGDVGVFLLFAAPATVGALLAVLAELIDWRRGRPVNDPMSAVQLLSTGGMSALRVDKPRAERSSDAQRRC